MVVCEDCEGLGGASTGSAFAPGWEPCPECESEGIVMAPRCEDCGTDYDPDLGCFLCPPVA